MKQVIFVNGIWPNQDTDPIRNYTRTIGPYQLKHWLKKHNISSQVIDFAQLFTGAELFDMLKPFVSPETKIIGMSSTFWPFTGVPQNIRELMVLVHDEFPELLFIAGGARTPRDAHLFDEIFSGESEDALLVYCQEKLGIRGRALFNKRFNINTLDHMFDEDDAIMPDEVLPIELGRGCIFKCKFCAHANLGKAKHTYQREHGLILAELAHNHKTFGTTRYNFLDDTVNEDHDKVVRMSRFKDDLGFEIEWNGYLRADLVWSKKDSPELLARSGMRTCFFGIETFHLDAGRSIDKSWAARHGKEFLPKLYNEIWDKKIPIYNSMITGLPGEPIESHRETAEWCLENPIGWHWFNPLTLYVEKADEKAQSIFTKNYKDYGYRNVRPDGHWESDQMDSSQCMELSRELNGSLIKGVNTVSSWFLFNAMNLGLTFEEARILTMGELKTIMAANRSAFMANYRQALKKRA